MMSSRSVLLLLIVATCFIPPIAAATSLNTSLHAVWSAFARTLHEHDSKSHHFDTLVRATSSPQVTSSSSTCDFTSCTAHFTSFGKDAQLILPCSVASGALPLQPHLPPILPLVFAGNYDLCNTFEGAHFCVARTAHLFLPLDTNNTKFFILGPMVLGECVPHGCGEADVRRRFVGQASAVAEAAALVTHSQPTREFIKYLEGYIAQTSYVSCSDMAREDYKVDGWVIGFVVIVGVLVVLVVVATSVEVWRCGGNEWLRMFSGVSNARRLFAHMEDSRYASLNGIRVISMMWWVVCE